MLLNEIPIPSMSIPSWLKDNVQLLVLTGSRSYGCENADSDYDIEGIVIPPKQFIYGNNILLEYDKIPVFQQWELKDIKHDNKLYSFRIYSINRYFTLVEGQNPNLIDGLFVPRRCVLYSTPIGEKIRENRQMFLSKGCYHRFKSYAFSQLKLLGRKHEGKRVELVKQFGYDVKAAYNLVRLVLECEQILQGDLILDRDREQYKSIRRGDWSQDQLKQWFYDKERYLEELYQKSTLPEKPNHENIRNLLLECIQHHYGEIVEPSDNQILNTFQKIKDLINSIG